MKKIVFFQSLILILSFIGFGCSMPSTPAGSSQSKAGIVMFDSNGGSLVSSITGEIRGSTIQKPDNPTKSEYDFVGWYKEKSCINPWNFTTDIITSVNTYLYAKWAPAGSKTITVYFITGGGSYIAPYTNVSLNSKITQPSPPTRQNYSFEGWFKDIDCISTWNFDTYIVGENLETPDHIALSIYAKWLAQ